MEDKNKIVIAVTDFSVSPGPRYCIQGEDSGEAFYHEVLNAKFAEAFQYGMTLNVVLDGADGYASSFLDEAFGNLVYDFGCEAVLNTVVLTSDEEPEWIDMIVQDTYPQWQKRRKENKAPLVTVQHHSWYRMVDNELKNYVWEKTK